MAVKPERIKRGHSFNQIHATFLKHKDIIYESLEKLESKAWITFCFLKILHCNGAFSCSFSKAWCVTMRNFEDSDRKKKVIVRFPNLFNVAFLKYFTEKKGDIESTMTDNQLAAFQRLATFLDKIDDKGKFQEIHEQSTKTMSESTWAAVLGTHVLRKLAVSDEMMVDTGYAGKKAECPCGCQTPVVFGDTSIGHIDVWHGSLDIILGPVAISSDSSADSDNSDEESSSTLKYKTGEFEESRSQLIAETIVFSYLRKTGLVPTLGVSKNHCKVFMYDPEYDFLYESSELPLFDVFGNLDTTAILVLWFVINYGEFCTGVKHSHEELGYKAGFKTFLSEPVLNIYENELKRGGCKHAQSGEKKGKYTAFQTTHYLSLE